MDHPHPLTARRIWALIVALAVALTGLVMPAATASETATGKINISLNYANDLDLTGVVVTLRSDGGVSYQNYYVDPVTFQGVVTFDGLRSEEFFISITGPNIETSYGGDVTKFEDRQLTTLAEGEEITLHANLIHAQSGTVSIPVTAELGVDLSGAKVELVRWHSEGGSFETRPSYSLPIDSSWNGEPFAFENVRIGVYTARVVGDYIPHTYPGSPWGIDDAERIEVTRNQLVQTTNVIQLKPTRTGNVNFSFDLAEDFDVTQWSVVEIYRAEDINKSDAQPVRSEWFNFRDSGFGISNLIPGSYVAKISSDYFDTFYSGGTATITDAQPFIVEEYKTTQTETVRLNRGMRGKVEFSVDGLSNLDLYDIKAEVLTSGDGAEDPIVVTSRSLGSAAAGNGKFSIYSVAAGQDYVLRIRGTLINDVYSGGAQSIESATTFDVVDGEIVQVGAMTVSTKPLGSLRVDIDYPEGVSWAGASLTLLRRDTQNSNWASVGWVSLVNGPPADGVLIENLLLGEYAFQVSGQEIIPVFSGNAKWKSDAEPISVTHGIETQASVIITPKTYGQLSVPVEVAEGANLSGATITLNRYDQDYGSWVYGESRSIDHLAAGTSTVTFNQLEVGTYVVHITGPHIDPLLSGGGTWAGDATSYEVAENAHITTEEFTISRAIAGTVVVPLNVHADEDPYQITVEIGTLKDKDNKVSFESIKSQWLGFGNSQQVTFNNVPVGDYVVRVRIGGARDRYNGNVRRLEDAVPFSVELDQTVTLNPALEIQPVAFGTVQIPLSGIEDIQITDETVVVLRPAMDHPNYSGDELARRIQLTEGDSGFGEGNPVVTVTEVPAGAYYVEVIGDSIETVYSGNASSSAEALRFMVVGGESVAIDPIQLRPAQIGNLVVPLTFGAIGDASFYVYAKRIVVENGIERFEQENSTWISAGQRPETVTFNRLPVGNYIVTVAGYGIATTHSGNVYSETDATRYVVAVGSTTTADTVNVRPPATGSVRIALNIPAGLDLEDAEVTLSPAYGHPSSTGEERSQYAEFADGDFSHENPVVEFDEVPLGAYLVRINGSYFESVYSGNVIDVDDAQTKIVAEDQLTEFDPIQLIKTVYGTVNVPFSVEDGADLSDARIQLRVYDEEYEEWYTEDTMWFEDLDPDVRAASFERVPRGTYIIRVRGTAIDTVYSGNGASVDTATQFNVVDEQAINLETIAIKSGSGGQVSVPIDYGTVTPDYIEVELWKKFTVDGRSWFESDRELYFDTYDGLPSEAVFKNVTPGEYKVRVYGDGIESIFNGNVSRVGDALSFQVGSKQAVSVDTILLKSLRYGSLSVPVDFPDGLTLGSDNLRLEPAYWRDESTSNEVSRTVWLDGLAADGGPALFENLPVGAYLVRASGSNVGTDHATIGSGLSLSQVFVVSDGSALSANTLELSKKKFGSVEVPIVLPSDAVPATTDVELYASYTLDGHVERKYATGRNVTSAPGSNVFLFENIEVGFHSVSHWVEGFDRAMSELTPDTEVVEVKEGQTARFADIIKAQVTPAITNVAVPVVSGKTIVGESLQATAGEWSVSGADVLYQWFADGSEIPGATGNSLKLAAAQQGKVITVRVTASKTGFDAASAVSAATAKVAAAPAPKPTPVPVPKPSPAPAPAPKPTPIAISNTAKAAVSGTAGVGKKVSAKVGKWSVSGVKYTYQWLANGKAIKNATKSSYTIPSSMVGKKITVKVTATKAGHVTGTSVSSAKTVAKSSASISAKLAKTTLKRSKKTSITVTVKSPGVSKPTGTVYVKVGKKTVKASLKASHKGKIKVTLRGSSFKVAKKEKVTVSFTPSKATGKLVAKPKPKSGGRLSVVR